MKIPERKYDLEERLIDFAISISKIYKNALATNIIQSSN